MESKTLKKDQHQIEEDVQAGVYSNLEGMLKFKQSENQSQHTFKPFHRLNSKDSSGSEKSEAKKTQNHNIRITVMGIG